MSRFTKVYLACPYYHDDPEVRWNRFKEVTATAAILMMRGYNVFSPITMTDPMHHATKDIDKYSRMFLHDYYLSRDLEWIDVCDTVWVLNLDGWDESMGVSEEIRYARHTGKSVYLIDKDGDKIKKFE